MMMIRLLAAAALLCAGAAQAIEIPALQLSRLTDSTDGPSDRSSEPDQFRTIDGVLYFSAAAPGLGTELYRTDGTPDGLRLVRDFAPGPASSNPTALGKAGGKLIVFANDRVHGRQFWALSPDGTATRISAGIFSDAYTNLPTPIGNAGNRLLVLMTEGNVWSTDGTAAGTFDLSAASGLSLSTALKCALDGSLVLAADGYDYNRRAILRTDGTVAGTLQVGTLPEGVYFRSYAAEVMNGRCYLLYAGEPPSSPWVVGWTLLESDGTAAGTRVSASSATGTPAGLASLGDALYIRHAETSTLRLLRRGPGATAFSTVIQLSTGQAYVPGSLWRIGNRLAFGAPYLNSNDVYVSGVYTSDGTQVGTRRVFPLNGGTWNGDARPALGGLLLDSYDNDAYLSGVTGAVTLLPPLGMLFYQRGDTVGGVYAGYGRDAVGSEVWRTDGTAAGTGRLYDVWPATIGSLAQGDDTSLVIGDAVYAPTVPLPTGTNGALANSILRSDGTPAGLRRLPPGAHAPGVVQAILPFGDGIAFKLVNPPSYSTGRWYRADALLAGASPISENNLAQSGESMVAGGRVIFGCDRPPVFDSLCAAGGGGTVDTLAPSLAGVKAMQPVGNIGGTAVFTAGNALWRSDGTTAGTYTLDVPGPSAAFQAIGSGLAFNGKLYFGTCVQDDSACRLMSTDGTLAGTGVVAALPASAHVYKMAALGGRFVFMTSGNSVAPQLWRSDGTTAGTQVLLTVPSGGGGQQLEVIGDKAHFRVDCYGTPCVELYFVTDGTPAGTRQVPLAQSIKPTRFLGAIGSEALLFACYRPSTGDELCAIDREGQQARSLADVFPGPTSSNPGFSMVARTAAGLVYLGLDDGAHGTELWQVRALPDALFADDFD